MQSKISIDFLKDFFFISETFYIYKLLKLFFPKGEYLLDETDNKILVFIKIVSATRPSSVPVLYFIEAVT